MKLVYRIAVMLLFVLGCEDDTGEAITDGSVYTELIVRYDETANTTTGTAWFWQGQKTGRWLIFNPDAVLTFQEQIMDYRTADHAYLKEMKNWIPDPVFSFTDINKKTFVNSIDVKQIDFPAGTPDTLDTSQPYTVSWSAALENNESVTLRIGNASVTQDTIGKSSVVFSTAQFSSLTDKSTTMAIERLKNNSLDADLGGGGFIRAEYISQSRNVYLK